MTPIEQDKERRYHLASCEMYETLRGIFPNDRRLTGKSCSCGLKEFITADRKRVALEAELDVLTYLLDERTERMFMRNPDTGEMTGNSWLCNTSLSAVSANRIEAERRKRIAELKDQQEKL